MTAGPLPAGVIHAIVDCAYHLPPGTSAERWAALMDPEPELGSDAEAEADEWDEPEWDSQDSNAYQDRVEAGLEPEAEL